VAYSEIERFPSEVLAHHYPSTPNLGDMTKFKEWSIESNVDLLVGGTPCQSFSVAGLRKGLDDPRGNLMLTYLAIADKYRPRWLVWENVPGVLSSNGGEDFGTFLGGLGELGYGFAYRVLDAQYFGVAQRRRRVFVVGHLGDWRRAAAVLFERHSLQGHPAPSREKRKEVTECAGTLTANGGGLNRPAGNANELDFCITVSKQWPAEISSTLDTTFGSKQGLEDQHVNAGCPMFVPAYGIPGNWIGRKPENGGNATEPMHDIAPCLTKTDQHGVAAPIAFTTEQTPKYNHDQALTLTKSESKHNQCVAAPIAFSGCDDGMDSQINVTPTMRIAGNAQGNLAVAVGTDIYNAAITGDVAVPLTNRSDGTGTGPKVMQPFQQTADCLTAAYGTKWNGNASATNGSLFVAHPKVVGALACNTGPNGHDAGNFACNQAVDAGHVLPVNMAVRRLTPKECERLQGFPDSYTDIKSKNKPTPDGPRYKALGNSMAVPVMAWIGQRIEQVEAICKQNK
jgi:DNA (cytosine-5)-methyltransferase 1